MDSKEIEYMELLQSAAIQLASAQQNIRDLQTQMNEPIAIIGMAGRFPGAINANQYFKNLLSSTESISILTNEQLSEAGIPEESYNLPNYIKAKGLLSEYDLFDPLFFDLSQKEAKIMDPQIRLFMETAWQAMEDAGYYNEAAAGRVGVFAGMSDSHSYLDYLKSHLDPSESGSENLQVMINNFDDFL